MSDIVKKIQDKPGFVSLAGIAREQIEEAEKTLGVKFAKEYLEYVTALGAASFENHEMTGICASQRLNVVNVTEKERTRNSDIPADWYVVEQANIDDIVIWQSGAGEIFQTMPGAKPVRLFESLAEYINT